jgi:hypothetical protein
MSDLNFSVPPLFCSRCRRELRSLCCLACALARLTASGLVANAREIRALARRPTGKIGARTDCAICSQSMSPGEKAYLMSKGVAAHGKCVRTLCERLDEAMPQRQAPRPGELLFEGEGLEVK